MIRIWRNVNVPEIYVRLQSDGQIILCNEEGSRTESGVLIGSDGGRVSSIHYEYAKRAGVELNSNRKITDAALNKILQALAKELAPSKKQ